MTAIFRPSKTSTYNIALDLCRVGFDPSAVRTLSMCFSPDICQPYRCSFPTLTSAVMLESLAVCRDPRWCREYTPDGSCRHVVREQSARGFFSEKGRSNLHVIKRSSCRMCLRRYLYCLHVSPLASLVPLARRCSSCTAGHAFSCTSASLPDSHGEILLVCSPPLWHSLSFLPSVFFSSCRASLFFRRFSRGELSTRLFGLLVSFCLPPPPSSFIYSFSCPCPCAADSE